MAINEHIQRMLDITGDEHALEVDYQRTVGPAFVVRAVRNDQDSQLAGTFPAQDLQSEIEYSIALSDFRAALGGAGVATAEPRRGDKIRDPAGSDGAWQVIAAVHRQANRLAMRVVVKRGGEL